MKYSLKDSQCFIDGEPVRLNMVVDDANHLDKEVSRLEKAITDEQKAHEKTIEDNARMYKELNNLRRKYGEPLK